VLHILLVSCFLHKRTSHSFCLTVFYIIIDITIWDLACTFVVHRNSLGNFAMFMLSWTDTFRWNKYFLLLSYVLNTKDPNWNTKLRKTCRVIVNEKVVTASALHSTIFTFAKLKTMCAGTRYMTGKQFSLNICVLPLRFCDMFGTLKQVWPLQY